jgi:hypothetical protein
MNHRLPDDPRELADRIEPATMPRVAGFLAGYLHEDWTLDYGSPAEAMYDYLREADWDDVEELAAEWELIDVASRTMPLAELADLFQGRFRAAWRPVSRAEIEAITAELERALAE